VEVFTRVLRTYAVPKEHIQQLVLNALVDGYDLLRMTYHPLVTNQEPYVLSDSLALQAMRMKDNHPHLSKPLGQWDFLVQMGVTVIALQRGTQSMTQIDDTLLLKPDDQIILMGSVQALQQVTKHFPA
jgi:K+/H+ antiporter YhaU regulatory subunit KhtT